VNPVISKSEPKEEETHKGTLRQQFINAKLSDSEFASALLQHVDVYAENVFKRIYVLIPICTLIIAVVREKRLKEASDGF